MTSSQTDAVTSTPGGSQKRRKPDTEGSPDKLTQLLDTPVNLCGHCKKKCTAKSEALQCDLCASWLHASCEGITREDYKLLNQLSSSTQNIVYYCNLNHCLDRFKTIMAQWTQNAPSKIDQLESKLIAQINKVSESSYSSLSSENKHIGEAISELSLKIDQLQSREEEIQNQIKETSNTLFNAHDSSSQLSAPSSVADTIVQELEDKKRRRNNVIFYNIPEPDTPNQQIDSNYVLTLCKETYKLDVQILKAFRLGKKLPNKSRPLLIQLENDNIKAKILAKSYLLKSVELYRNIYVSNDMTKTERAKHKQLVEELKSRRAKGETNIVIRGNAIITKPNKRLSNTTTSGTTNGTPMESHS